MPKRGAIALLITSAALVLLLNFKTPQTVGTVATGANQSVVSGPAATSATGASTTSGTGAAAAVAGSKSGTLTGTTVQTQFGPVQVQVTVSNGKITAVRALQTPADHPRSAQISQYAIPVLVQETLQAQSAQINAVSGATYTSQAYMQSLQSALDQAAG